MDELLAPHVKLPIEEASDGAHLAGGRIYLCPPGVIPKVNGMVLHLEPRPKGKALVLPINILIASMARTLGSSAAAVILSGTGSDGSEGIESLVASGGVIAVQQPDTADFTGMPQSALSTGHPSIVAPPREIWALLAKFIKGESIDQAYTPGFREDLVDAGTPDPFDEDAYRELFGHLNQLFGLNFSLYGQQNEVSPTFHAFAIFPILLKPAAFAVG